MNRWLWILATLALTGCMTVHVQASGRDSKRTTPITATSTVEAESEPAATEAEVTTEATAAAEGGD